MASVAVIIPTRNRPDDLTTCLASLASQERVPDLVVVSDYSDDDASRLVCERASSEGSLDVRWVPNERGGVTWQRNVGLEAVPAGADLVMFCDDDVLLDAGYVRALVDDLSLAENSDVVGAEGVAEHAAFVSWSKGYRLYAAVFGLGSADKRGQWLASGINVAPPDDGPSADVEWLFGCAMYRMKAIAGLRFSEELAGYATYEDVDFSLQARSRGRLIVVPRARLVHNESPVARQRLQQATAMQMVNRHWLLSRHGRFGWRVAYWWSILGLWLLYAWRGGLRRRPDDLERFAGVRDGTWRVVRGEGPS